MILVEKHLNVMGSLIIAFLLIERILKISHSVFDKVMIKTTGRWHTFWSTHYVRYARKMHCECFFVCLVDIRLGFYIVFTHTVVVYCDYICGFIFLYIVRERATV